MFNAHLLVSQYQGMASEFKNSLILTFTKLADSISKPANFHLHPTIPERQGVLPSGMVLESLSPKS